jgi:hypothetical protein
MKHSQFMMGEISDESISRSNVYGFILLCAVQYRTLGAHHSQNVMGSRRHNRHADSHGEEAMKVDARKIKAGDTIHFRCGGSCVVDCAAESQLYPGRAIFITFVGSNHGINVNKAGKLISRFSEQPVNNCPFDIVKVEEVE